MLFSVLTLVMSLTQNKLIFTTNGSAKRIILIRLHLLENGVIALAEHRRPSLLVGVEDDVIAIRNIVAVHGHALEVVRAINGDSNLRIASFA